MTCCQSSVAGIAGFDFIGICKNATIIMITLFASNCNKTLFLLLKEGAGYICVCLFCFWIYIFRGHLK